MDIPGKIRIPTPEGFEYINPAGVIWCEAQQAYTLFHPSSDRKFIASGCLSYYEELLGKDGFLRIHRSRLINVKHLVKYVKGRGGYVLMSDKTMLRVAIRRKTCLAGSLRKQNDALGNCLLTRECGEVYLGRTVIL